MTTSLIILVKQCMRWNGPIMNATPDAPWSNGPRCHPSLRRARWRRCLDPHTASTPDGPTRPLTHRWRWQEEMRPVLPLLAVIFSAFPFSQVVFMQTEVRRGNPRVLSVIINRYRFLSVLAPRSPLGELFRLSVTPVFVENWSLTSWGQPFLDFNTLTALHTCTQKTYTGI